LATGSRTVRGTKRELISRTYNRIIHLTFRNRFRDAQCGFKAVRSDVARALLPAVADEEWFFDTELLLLAERNGLRIAEVPVDWIDDPDSRVRIVSTASADLKGLARMAWAFWRGRGIVELGDARRSAPPTGTGGQLLSFATVGVVSTTVTLGIFVLLRTPLGSQWAMVVALTVPAVANLAANRRWTFGRTGSSGRRGEWLRAGGVHLAGLALAMGALALAHAIDGGSLATELLLISLAFIAATALRVVLLPTWIFGGTR
jgi:putative flippase GtrA